MSSWIAARELSIEWGDDKRYWKWAVLPDSAGEEVAELVVVSWLIIRGKIDSRRLHPKTAYAAYFVFKVEEKHDNIDKATAAVRFLKGKPDGADDEGYTVFIAKKQASGEAGRFPQKRGDGWMEVKLGDFYNNVGGDGELEMRVWHKTGQKSGLVVRGIDVRPY